MQRYMIHKGYEGFGDRLQSLSFCIDLAKMYNRTLYVDWYDKIWNDDFYEYFFFEGIDFTTECPTEYKTVYPTFWENGLGLVVDKWIHHLPMVKFDQDQKKFEDVWVHPGIGFRRWDISMIVDHLRLMPDVHEQIKQQVAKHDPELPVVHLRGTDRTDDKTFISVMELSKKVPVAHVVSDDSKLVDMWQSVSPSSTFEMTNVAHHFNRTSDKRKSNIKALSDFFILASAKEAHGIKQEESAFFKMARLFNTFEGHKKWNLI
jgi:hypothetical protein